MPQLCRRTPKDVCRDRASSKGPPSGSSAAVACRPVQGTDVGESTALTSSLEHRRVKIRKSEVHIPCCFLPQWSHQPQRPFEKTSVGAPATAGKQEPQASEGLPSRSRGGPTGFTGSGPLRLWQKHRKKPEAGPPCPQSHLSLPAGGNLKSACF